MSVKSPIGVSSYKVNLMEKLPKELKGKLPTIEEIENELSIDIKSEMVKSRKSVKTGIDILPCLKAEDSLS